MFNFKEFIEIVNDYKHEEAINELESYHSFWVNVFKERPAGVYSFRNVFISKKSAEIRFTMLDTETEKNRFFMLEFLKTTYKWSITECVEEFNHVFEETGNGYNYNYHSSFDISTYIIPVNL